MVFRIAVLSEKYLKRSGEADISVYYENVYTLIRHAIEFQDHGSITLLRSLIAKENSGTMHIKDLFSSNIDETFFEVIG